MGRKKKSWIDKKKAKSYFLVHRSVRDDLNEDSDEDGGDDNKGVKLVPMEPSLNRMKRNESDSILGKDFVDQMGFANDGYDYSQHLKPMGGGVFIGKDGKEVSVPLDANDAQAVQDDADDILMQDMLAAEATGMTQFTTTLPAETMDEDLKKALFDEADEEGEFEGLDDDFVSQVIVEPEGGFDFDAHIAKLMARFDDGPTKIHKEHRLDEYSDGDWVDDDFADEDEEGEEMEDRTMLPEDRRVMEEQFARTLQEYGDDQMGYMDEEDEGEVGGFIELDELEDHALMMQAIEEMEGAEQSTLKVKGRGRMNRSDDKLGVKKWGIGPHGARVRGGDGSLLRMRPGDRELPIPIKAAVEDAEEVLRSIRIDADAEAPVAKPSEIADLVQKSYEVDAYGPGVDHIEIETSQEYLREQMEREIPQWDCETILSTYSTLDNHPSVVGAPSRTKPSRAAKKLMREQRRDDSSVMTGNTGATGRSFSRGGNKLSAPERILLTSKLGIPRGFGASVNANPKQPRQPIIDERAEEEEEEEEDEAAAMAEDEKEAVWEERAPKGRTKETSEERRQRKAAVKEDRRQKRAGKKALKLAYKDERTSMLRDSCKAQDIDGVSTFRY